MLNNLDKIWIVNAGFWLPCPFYGHVDASRPDRVVAGSNCLIDICWAKSTCTREGVITIEQYMQLRSIHAAALIEIPSKHSSSHQVKYKHEQDLQVGAHIWSGCRCMGGAFRWFPMYCVHSSIPCRDIQRNGKDIFCLCSIHFMFALKHCNCVPQKL